MRSSLLLGTAIGAGFLAMMCASDKASASVTPICVPPTVLTGSGETLTAPFTGDFLAGISCVTPVDLTVAVTNATIGNPVGNGITLIEVVRLSPGRFSSLSI